MSPFTPAQRRRRRILFGVLGVLVAVILASRLPALGQASHQRSGGGSDSQHAAQPRPHSTADPQTPHTAQPGLRLLPVSRAGKGHLAPGSDPSVLPGPVLVADKLNNRVIVVDPRGRVRWRFPRRGDLRPGQSFRIPDDAFFTPDGRHIIATEEDDDVISVISTVRHRIVWRYGNPGVPGSGRNHVSNPDDGMLLPNRTVVAGDIRNCRIIKIRYPRHRLSWSNGHVGACTHAPPAYYGSPNGMFPMPHHRFLVTEINGDWVDAVTSSGRVLWSTHPPGVAYPSDTNVYAPGKYLTVDYSDPGQIVLFNRWGHVLWRFAPTGKQHLDMPSLALPLPNGDIIANDDANHRVIVVDPHRNRIVWQYGHTGRSGSRPGFLDNPDGIDLLPPYAYADRQTKAFMKPSGGSARRR